VAKKCIKAPKGPPKPVKTAIKIERINVAPRAEAGPNINEIIKIGMSPGSYIRNGKNIGKRTSSINTKENADKTEIVVIFLVSIILSPFLGYYLQFTDKKIKIALQKQG
jgi:hypothetical protein